MKNIFACVISIGFVAFLSCQPRQFRKIQNNIGLCATVCADEEYIVDTDGWQLTAVDFIEKGYIPVRVQIKNMSNQVVCIGESSIPYKKPDLPQLIDFFKYSVRKRAIARGALRQALCVGTGIISVVYGMINSLHGHNKLGRIEDRPVWVTIFLLCAVAAAINVCILTPYDFITLENCNKKLGGALRKALPTGPAVATLGLSAEKIFLIPQDTNKPFEFQVFNEYTDAAVAIFYINIF